MFNLFKSYTFSWQEIGVFKLALLTIGMLIGANWSEFVQSYQLWIAVIAVTTTGYILYVSLRQ